MRLPSTIRRPHIRAAAEGTTHDRYNPKKSLAEVILLPFIVSVHGCNDHPVRTMLVSLANTETFEFPTVGGDEQGARIATQAKHYSISEIRRIGDNTGLAVYVYQPLPGFVGRDYAEIEIFTNPDGVGPPSVRRVAFAFVIHD